DQGGLEQTQPTQGHRSLSLQQRSGSAHQGHVLPDFRDGGAGHAHELKARCSGSARGTRPTDERGYLDDARGSLKGAIQAYLSLVDSKTNTSTRTSGGKQLAEFCNNGVCRPFGAGGLGAAAPAGGGGGKK
ncbi:MAG: hypothetical protein IAF94_22245, partial [Pirellulaceae bacterium]|nr:hypothetical protein [Pirellulaceae bacterium]